MEWTAAISIASGAWLAPDQTDLIQFDDGRSKEISIYFTNPWAEPYLAPLDRTSELIDGFESPFGMELLATVDWLITKAGCTAAVPNVRDGLSKWPASRAAARRKQKLFNDRMLEVAVDPPDHVRAGGTS